MNKFYTFLAAILLTTSTFAQAPEKMSYQAVIRNSGDALVTNQAVGMRISILQTTATGTAVYVETQTPTTNINGLVSLEIGAGTPVTGTFAGIDWAAGPYFIKTETDPTGSTTYTIAGTSQLMSVPYALYAKTVADKTYTIGLWPELGGYVFRISADGKHGLVAETQDQGTSEWYNAQNLISDPSSHSIYGKKFMDWRLPTIFELQEMYNNKSSIGNFLLYYYWSSTEFDTGSAWDIGFDIGNSNFENKVYSIAVRAVRAF